MCWRPEWEGYGQAPNVIDISYGSLRCPTDPGHVVSLQTTGPLYGTMGFELTIYMYQWSLCRKPRPQVQRSNANGFNPLVAFYDAHMYTEDLFFYTPESRRRYNYKQNSEYYYATFKTTISHLEFKYILTELVSNSVFVTILIKIPLTTFTCIITLNLNTFSECGYSYHPSKLIMRSLISVFHIGLVIARRSVVLAFGFASGQYDRPRRNN